MAASHFVSELLSDLSRVKGMASVRAVPLSCCVHRKRVASHLYSATVSFLSLQLCDSGRGF